MRHSADSSCFRAAVVFTAAAFASCSAALAQARASSTAAAGPASAAPAVAASYAPESAVIESLDSVYTYAADGTCVYEHSVSVRVQSEAAVRELGVINVPYASGTQQVEFLYARVRHADGSVVDSASSDAIDMPAPVTREAPFYSDLKGKQLPIRGLRSGDTLEWKARITSTKAEAPGQFWDTESFTQDAVVLQEKLELRYPEGLHVTVWSPKYKPEEWPLTRWRTQGSIFRSPSRRRERRWRS